MEAVERQEKDGGFMVSVPRISPCTLGRSFNQAAESHHCPRCERHRAGEAARGNPHKHQKTVPPGQSSFTLTGICVLRYNGADFLLYFCHVRW